MGRQIRPATSLDVNCNGANSLQVINNDGTFCFSQPNSTHLDEARPGGGTENLLTGSPVALTVSNFSASASGTVATVSFQLQDNRQNSMAFTTALGRRN
jgi:hypothetical protein